MSTLSDFITDRQSQMPPHLAGLPHNVRDEVTFIVTGLISVLCKKVPVTPGDIWVHYGRSSDIREQTYGWPTDSSPAAEKALVFGYATHIGEVAMRLLTMEDKLRNIMEGVIIPTELLEPKEPLKLFLLTATWSAGVPKSDEQNTRLVLAPNDYEAISLCQFPFDQVKRCTPIELDQPKIIPLKHPELA